MFFQSNSPEVASPHTPLNAGRSTQDSASNSTSRASRARPAGHGGHPQVTTDGWVMVGNGGYMWVCLHIYIIFTICKMMALLLAPATAHTAGVESMHLAGCIKQKRIEKVTWFENLWSRNVWVPSGKHTKSYGKSPFFIGKSTINGHLQYLYIKLPEGTVGILMNFASPMPGAPQREITEYLDGGVASTQQATRSQIGTRSARLWGEKRILSVQVHQCQELSNLPLKMMCLAETNWLPHLPLALNTLNTSEYQGTSR